MRLFLVLTTLTLFVLESKTSKIARLDDIAIRPGEPPALISDARAVVSFAPLMMTRPGLTNEAADALRSENANSGQPARRLANVRPTTPARHKAEGDCYESGK